jgi:hypothetical protein
VNLSIFQLTRRDGAEMVRPAFSACPAHRPLRRFSAAKTAKAPAGGLSLQSLPKDEPWLHAFDFCGGKRCLSN